MVILRESASMLEEMEEKEGIPVPRRRGAGATGPEPSSIDHVLTDLIMNGLGKDRKLIQWRAARLTNGSSTTASIESHEAETKSSS